MSRRKFSIEFNEDLEELKKHLFEPVDNVPTHLRIYVKENGEIVIPKENNGEQMQQDKATLWSVVGNQSFYPCDSVVNKLPPGQYKTCRDPNYRYYLERMEIPTDEDLLVDEECLPIVKNVETFWKNKDLFSNHGFIWKRGILLYGPPGSGKTTTVQTIAQNVIEKGGISLYCVCPEYLDRGLSMIRKAEPERPVVVIFEDIDEIINVYGEKDVLSILDGENQVGNVVYLATTNYPEKLDARIINRPSRFDEVLPVGMPNAALRRKYLQMKNPRLKGAELEHWVSSSHGCSIAHLKELIVSVECLGNSLESTIERIHNMKRKISSGNFQSTEFGLNQE